METNQRYVGKFIRENTTDMPEAFSAAGYDV